MKSFREVIVFVAILLITTSAIADTIYNNMGDGGHFYNDRTVVVKGYSSYQADAVAFTPSNNFTLSQLTIPLKVAQIGATIYPETSRVDLVADNGGKPGTTALESWTMPSLSTTGSLKTFTSVGTQLNSGTTYWVAIYPLDFYPPFPYTWVYWCLNWQGITVPSGGNFSTYNGSTWTAASANSLIPGLTVEGTAAVPIPPSAWLLVSGVIGFMGLRRKFKK